MSDSTRTSILFASSNRHKTAEIQALLGENFIVSDLSSRDGFQPPEENGDTFEANALIKAVAAAAHASGPVIADDSGLEVDALSGAPGIHTARFAGINATDRQNREKLIASLSGQPNRNARFVCVLALIKPGHPAKLFRGEIRGSIALTESGMGGFGYDPLFVPSGCSESFAELAPEMKNTLSHRAMAVQKLLRSGSL
jgi:XTP/dITP diphosphohydrolase